MYFIGEALVTSASDLTTASSCEYAFLRTLDRKLGFSDIEPPQDDAMLKLAGELGDVHEQGMLERYRKQFAGDVIEFERPSGKDAEVLRDFAERTREALRSGAAVVFQAVFFDESDPALPFVGFADFLVKQPSGTYRVVDTKLARHVKTTALMQLAAYHEQLRKLGINVDDTVELILGNHAIEQAHIDDIRPVFEVQRQHMHELIARHRAGGVAVAWGDDRISIDGSCKFCKVEMVEQRDLLLVANLRRAQRDKLRAVGLHTIDDLAATPVRPAGCSVPESTYATLQQQAELQVRAMAQGGEVPPFELLDARVIENLPAPSAGDLFFDFEGDPMFLEQLPDGRPQWGLDYLFGWVDAQGTFAKLWAHSVAEEKQALIDFLAFVEARRAEYPDLHIYHYASYEKTHLLSIAARHGVGEAAVDRLLREQVLVDLLPVVRKALRVGSPSYSIKKLEPLYMSEEAREGVSNAADSVVEYRRAAELRDAGQAAEAQAVFNDIEQYNAYDCVSTLKLRDWLIGLPGVGAVGRPVLEDDSAPFEESVLAAQLRQRAERILAGAAGNDEALERGRAFELVSAGIDYHQREGNAFWQAHFTRLEQPRDLWEDQRDVFTIDEVVAGAWETNEKGRSSRQLQLTGSWAPGSSNAHVDATPYALYESGDWPYEPKKPLSPNYRLAANCTIVKISDDKTSILIAESVPVGAEPWSVLPTHLSPGMPPRTESLATAIRDWATELEAAGDAGLPTDAAWKLLTRTGLECVPSPDVDHTADAVVATLLDMTDGFVAVQGPPGTGKTYLAGQVIAQLAGNGWTVGVVAQSHAVVENALNAVADAGLPLERIRKAMKTGQPAEEQPFRIASTAIPKYLGDFAGTGCVLGGTAWTVTNRNYVNAREFDLLVIDEAGQFSLANMIAAGLSAKRVLLLGDPQQLPQVSQAAHPAPVDGSALGHLAGASAVLPERFGYFLPQSRRMDPAVTRAVSALSYAGELESHAQTSGRSLDGVEPGLRAVPVLHGGNATSSQAEADEVVRIAREHLGKVWTDRKGSGPLDQDSIIVITPYNAQVQVIRETLDAAGLSGIDVGTADKYQGREAVISIVSLAASDATEVPRGIDFLLSRNRLNVAISRAKWAAYLIYSPGLITHLPDTLESMAALSGFIRLTQH
ncbi:MAG: TM0106 family RecB-like putative nuclease [Microbacteriaceae bacterium]